MEYVSPKYEQQLTELAELLVTPERYSKLAEIAIETELQD